ncbi:MAG TPA: flippase activity-associated protein Agl23 [Roseiflexaceae bacterium]|nr:flippase activity-associated protein Agl23 [Roseiflexaceae bacterium]
MALLQRRSREIPGPTLLDRPLDLSWINIDVLAFGLLILLSTIAHLWALGTMALHHDESIHAWTSWRLYTGAGGFVCAGGRTSDSYCYDPVYHGPSLYMFTALSYFLFGDGDAQARLPQAIAGILMVASTWMLRPYLGRWGALLAGVLLAFSPSLLYYTRFARHDGLMILWTLWMVIGFFRYLDSGQGRFLYLLAAGTAFAIATHELYYILFFIFGTFVLIRLADEHLSHVWVMGILGLLLGICLAIAGFDPQISPTLSIGGLAFVMGTVFGLGLVLVRVWERRPILTERLVFLWQQQRGVLWTALAILAVIYVLNYSAFFTDPRGIIDGLYQGLAYWLGSQHEFARGKQPWYYYLMLLPIYEPLALFGATAAALYLFAWGRERILALAGLIFVGIVLGASQLFGVVSYVLAALPIGTALYLMFTGWWRKERPPMTPLEPEAVQVAPLDANTEQESAPVTSATTDLDEANGVAAAPATTPVEGDYRTRRLALPAPLFALFLAFWFIGALVLFSWAGEKMPWLLVHIALPGNLLVAWALGRVIESIGWSELPDRSPALVPLITTLMLVAFGVAMWRIQNGGGDQQGLSTVLQSLVPLGALGLMIFGLLTIGQRVGSKPTVALAALTVAGLLGAYMIRATWMVVYEHPDVPRDPLVYVQSTPDVPRISADIHTLAINQTRNIRSAADPAGGLSMPVIMDVGDANGEGNLSWPYQWYFRDLQRLERRNADFFRNATTESFQVPVDASQPEGEKVLAPVVMVSTGNVAEATRLVLEENYVKRYDTKLNWWYPEGDISGCDPRVAGYKQFYYSTSSLAHARTDSQCSSLPIDTLPYQSVFAPLLWPLQAEHWPDTWKFLLYRQLPEPLRLDGRMMQVWVRRDLAPNGGGGGGQTGAASSSDAVKLVAEQVFGGPQTLNQPRGIAVGPQGAIYVVDTGSHSIKIFNPDGTLRRSVGSLGSGTDQFNEPRGIAVDREGNLYVSDTWNARIVKLDPEGKTLKTWGTGGQDIGNGQRAGITDGTVEGNARQPLDFFGPRGIAVDDQGRVYLADTGNKRVVVMDSEGNFLFQWGSKGNAPGAFNEPIGVAVDGMGRVYVADTWNSRVQVFERGPNDQINPAPSVTWPMAGWQPNTYDDPYLSVTRDGDVYASLPGRNQVLKMDQRGVVSLRWGGRGTDTASLTLPSGLAVAPDGTVFVVDRGNNRVMHFQLPTQNPGG